MISVTNTPNYAGVAIHGDMHDFQKLYDALSELVGSEGEYKGFDNPRIRVLAICYDLRHAIMGDREFELVDNGMEEFKLRRAGFKAPDKNVYLSLTFSGLKCCSI